MQACHACIEVARNLLSPSDEHPHLVLCGVRSEDSLSVIALRLNRLGIAFRSFHEPDLNDQLTAIATEPIPGDQRRHFRRYQCLSTPTEGIA